MTTTPVHEKIIQAAADALLRFPDLPILVRKQFEGYITGEMVGTYTKIWTRVYKKQSYRQYPWLWLVDIKANSDCHTDIKPYWDYMGKNIEKYYSYLNEYGHNTCP